MAKLYVGHLAPHTRERELENAFREFGHIRQVSLKTDYAFVVRSEPFRTIRPLSDLHRPCTVTPL